tara:strand:+ start:108 stop:398 length:291 start_codon:yes stop_codon:yes gene_type:complete
VKVKLTRTLNFRTEQVNLLKKIAKDAGYNSWRDYVDSFVFSEGEEGLLDVINDRENYELWKEEEEEELTEVRDNASSAALVMHARKFYKGSKNEQS